MSKLSRESIEKAKRLLAKKQGLIEGGLWQEIEGLLARADAIASEYRGLKEAVKEKRLDIEDNARALARATRKAKKTAETAEAAQNVAAESAKKAEAVAKKRTAVAAPRKKPTPKSE
jgi:hypothetical protein